METLDQIKEQLSTLRVSLTLIVVAALTIGGAMVSVYNDSISKPLVPLNHLFYMGICSEFLIFISVWIIGLRIIRKIEEIGDL